MSEVAGSIEPGFVEYQVDTGQARLMVAERAGSEGAAILLHGGGHNLHTWDSFAPHLNPIRTVAVDLRGHGHSTSALENSLRTAITDIDTIIDVLELENPVIIGHSWGAKIAAAYAAYGNRECAGAVAVDAILGYEDGGYPVDDWDTWYIEMLRKPPKGYYAWSFSREEYREFIEGVLSTNDENSRMIYRVSQRQMLFKRDGKVYVRPTIDEYRTMVEAWAQDQEIITGWVERLRCPVMMAFGDGTPRYYEDFDQLCEHLNGLCDRSPMLRLRWFACGHSVHWMQAPELAKAVHEFAGVG